MSKIVSKKHDADNPFSYITYAVDKLNNNECVYSICNDLSAYGVGIKGIGVTTLSTTGEREQDVYIYNNFEDYLKDYGTRFNDNTIEGISIVCKKNGLGFKVEIALKQKKIFVRINKHISEKEFNIDGIVNKAINHQR